MKFVLTTLLGILLAPGSPALAHEPIEGNIYGSFGPFIHRTLPLHHGFDSPYQTGAGLIADGDLSTGGSLEIALFYLPQTFSIEQGAQTVVEDGKRIYIATGYRQWFTPKISGAVAFFSNYAISDAEITRNDFAPQPAPATSAESMVQYGFDFSVQVEPWQIGRWGVIVDARYSLSLTSKPGEDQNFYGLLVGLKYFVQGKAGENPDLGPPPNQK